MLANYVDDRTQKNDRPTESRIKIPRAWNAYIGIDSRQSALRWNDIDGHITARYNFYNLMMRVVHRHK